MMLSAITLALASLAAAAPASTQSYAPVTLSKGFRLVFNVTDLSRDLKDTPVHGLKLSPVRAGAGIFAPSVATSSGTAFFASADATVQWGVDGATPYGLEMADAATEELFVYGLSVDAGLGTAGFGVPSNPLSPHPCPALFAPRQGSFAVCDTGFDAAGHPRLLVRFVEGAMNDWYKTEHVPANCVAGKLMPECAPLTELDAATYPHDGIWDSLCYEDVASIDWSQHLPCW